MHPLLIVLLAYLGVGVLIWANILLRNLNPPEPGERFIVITYLVTLVALVFMWPVRVCLTYAERRGQRRYNQHNPKPGKT
jgi:hypothetical protein